jgi:hypothetical protein
MNENALGGWSLRAVTRTFLLVWYIGAVTQAILELGKSNATPLGAA